MAAATIWGSFINGITQGKSKEYMEKNKSNLEKHIKKVVPATRDEVKAPDTPTFSNANKTSFDLICSYIKDYNEYTITKINQNNEDNKDEILRDVALMITGNAGLLVENLDNAKEIKTNFVSSIETAAQHKISNENKFTEIQDEIKRQSAENAKGFKNLIPGDGTPGAVNHAEIIKAVEKCHQINESKVQTMIREQTSSINRTVKESTKQTGTGSNIGTKTTQGPPRATPSTSASAWGTADNPRPPPTQPNTQSSDPNPTQNPTQNPPPTGSGNAPNQEPEYITVTRPVAAVDDKGVEYTSWIDTLAKKRNPKFRFTKEAEDSAKVAESKAAETARARRQIMIYGLPDPPVGNKKTEIGNIRKVADEFSKKWLQDKGFNIQKDDLKNCETQRLWNYGGKTHKGPKPLKVTLHSAEVANKFMRAARAAGCDGSRSKIKFGKFQKISVDSEDWPKYFLRPGSTWEERQVFLAKKKERDTHKASDEYGRYTAAKERTIKNTHRVEEGDLDEFTFLDPDDCGEDDPDYVAPPKNKLPPGGAGKGSNSSANQGTGSSSGSGSNAGAEKNKNNEVIVLDDNNEMEASATIESTGVSGNLNGEGDKGADIEDAVEAVENESEIAGENDKKRKSAASLSPLSNQPSKKTSIAESSQKDL